LRQGGRGKNKRERKEGKRGTKKRIETTKWTAEGFGFRRSEGWDDWAAWVASPSRKG